jgi:FlaA1/EpsC-like NDP-sugar epimerase
LIRLVGKTAQLALDLAVLSGALLLAFLWRFDWDIPPSWVPRLFFAWPYVVGFEYAVLLAFGVHRFAWRYIGLREAVRILAATFVAGFVLLSARYMGAAAVDEWPHAQYAILPLGVILNNLALSFLGVAGIRISRRLQAERRAHHRRPRAAGDAKRTLLVGAGTAGVLVAKEIAAWPDLAMEPVGFLDDDTAKRGQVLHGIAVLGTTAELAAVARQKDAQQVLISIASAPGSTIRRITKLCEEVGLPVKIIPGIHEILDGKVNLSRIRDVAIEDLLGREPVRLDESAISGSMRGARVLVTGAAGSIGSELCRQLCRFAPAEVVLLDQSENGLFHIHRELLAAFPGVRLVPEVADICDAPRLTKLLSLRAPEIIFHAAAYKHVPMMEWNPVEAVKNNVLGTRILVDAALVARVREVVMVSTDKAVNPTSIMGTTKRLAEMYVQGVAQRHGVRFVTVRFGNVLGSAGSVVPLFQEQIARGGPVTVTDPEMRRYFMTIPEACQLILQAATMGQGGEIFVLDMGEPVRIVDLARDLIKLSGYRPDEDIEITITGRRPGEKLYEELTTASEGGDRTKHPKIMVGRSRPNDLTTLSSGIEALAALARTHDDAAVRRQLTILVPEYRPDTPDKVDGAPAERDSVRLRGDN